MLKEDEARLVVEQIVRGMAYLTEQNIIHRDIKLDNVLVCSKMTDAMDIGDFQFKIGDMGLAKALKN